MNKELRWKNKILFFHFYFLNKHYSVTIEDIVMKFKLLIQDILMEGKVSQNFDNYFCCVFKK